MDGILAGARRRRLQGDACAKTAIHRRHRGPAGPGYFGRKTAAPAHGARLGFCDRQRRKRGRRGGHHGHPREVHSRLRGRCDHPGRPRLGPAGLGKRDRPDRTRVPAGEPAEVESRLGPPDHRKTRVSRRGVYGAGADVHGPEGRLSVPLRRPHDRAAQGAGGCDYCGDPRRGDVGENCARVASGRPRDGRARHAHACADGGRVRAPEGHGVHVRRGDDRALRGRARPRGGSGSREIHGRDAAAIRSRDGGCAGGGGRFTCGPHRPAPLSCAPRRPLRRRRGGGSGRSACRGAFPDRARGDR